MKKLFLVNFMDESSCTGAGFAEAIFTRKEDAAAWIEKQPIKSLLWVQEMVLDEEAPTRTFGVFSYFDPYDPLTRQEVARFKTAEEAKAFVEKSNDNTLCIEYVGKE